MRQPKYLTPNDIKYILGMRKEWKNTCYNEYNSIFCNKQS